MVSDRREGSGRFTFGIHYVAGSVGYTAGSWHQARREKSLACFGNGTTVPR